MKRSLLLITVMLLIAYYPCSAQKRRMPEYKKAADSFLMESFYYSKWSRDYILQVTDKRDTGHFKFNVLWVNKSFDTLTVDNLIKVVKIGRSYYEVVGTDQDADLKLIGRGLMVKY